MRYEKRTDLAIEVKESFPKDHVEIPGVSLQENYDKLKKIKVTSVRIMNHIGARQMKKPIGTYTTIDFEERFIFEQKDYMDAVGKRLQKELAAILPHKIKRMPQYWLPGLEIVLQHRMHWDHMSWNRLKSTGIYRYSMWAWNYKRE